MRKLPSGRWQARIYDKATGRRSAVGVFRAKADADAALAVALRDQLHGTWARPELGQITLAAWSERWFDAKQGKRPKTRAFYRHVLDRYVLPELGGYRLARIDASLLRKWVAGLEVTGLSPTTVGHAYSVCKQVLDSAVEARYLAASPAIIKGLRSRSRPPSTWPSVDQVLALGEAVPDQWRAMILLAGLGGLRLGEVLALRREHVDLLRREVRVATQVVEAGGVFYEQTPKTAAGARTVALPDIVVTALDQHLTEYVPSPADALIFSAPEGGFSRRSNFYNRVWYPARKSVGLPTVRFHDLPHTALTLAAHTGATVAELQARAGHASPHAALRYQHVAEGRDVAIAIGLDAIVERARSAERALVVPIRPTPEGTLRARRPEGHADGLLP